MNWLVATLKVSFHTVSGEVWLPFASRCSWVPPTAVTSGSLGGQVVVGKVKYVEPSSPTLAAPLSPVAARTVM